MKTATRKASKKIKIADYIDTEGMELPEPTKGLSGKKQAKKDKKFVERAKAKAERDAAKTYHGAPIHATKVYRRDMPEFKNCKAECWMLINGEESYTFANTYNGLLKSSYDATHYTYPLNPKSHKKVNAKAEQMEEVEVTEWPTWIVNAAPKRGRKSSK